MSIEYFWRLPSGGDGREAISTRGDFGKGGRVAPRRIGAGTDGHGYIDYVSQVARAADINGFHGALLPTGRSGDEPWVVASALARETRNLHFLVAFQPGFLHPAYATQMAATLSRITNGRVDWNIITGGNPKEQRAYGDFFNHDERYARTGEFLDAFRGYAAGEPFNYQGNLYKFENGGLTAPLRNARLPGIYFSGSSEPAIAVAAKHADVYLMWAEPPQNIAGEIVKIRAAAQAEGRGEQIRFGIRVDVIARDTEEEAWGEVRRFYDSIPQELIETFKKARPRDESVGAHRQWALHNGKVDKFEDLIVSPNLWAGKAIANGAKSGQVGGPTCVLVGSNEQIAERLAEYVDIGISTFILAAKPHLEEAYRVGEYILPRVDGALERLRARRNGEQRVA